MNRIESLLVIVIAFSLVSCGDKGLKMGWTMAELSATAPGAAKASPSAAPDSVPDRSPERVPANQPSPAPIPNETPTDKPKPRPTVTPEESPARQDSAPKPRPRPSPHPRSTPSPRPTPAPRTTSGALLEDVLELTNIFRARHGLDPVEANLQLDDAAQRYAERMAAGDFFDHQSPEGDAPGDRIRDVGYRCQSCGENIAVDYATAAAVMKAWINSAAHRANLLNPDFTELGLGYATGTSRRLGRSTAYWVQEFGVPRTNWQVSR